MDSLKRLSQILTVVLLVAGGSAAAQELTEWTQSGGTLRLGYPVPEPVNTPLPFAGFRTYEGLHTRHQQLALENDKIEAVVVGQTTGGRDVWAYRLSDADSNEQSGLLEPAMMTNGGIHAREWQSPEVQTGIMERFAAHADDGFVHQYLMENASIIVLPVQNVDGFLQTQRFPTQNYIFSDPGETTGTPVNQLSPRDGRLRRKNMLTVDEEILTINDHLRGVDLNRNNPPYWATSGSSSTDGRSLVFHGAGPHSEPEGQALAAAAQLGPADRLRMYIDFHSFSQVYFSVQTANSRRNAIQATLLNRVSNYLAQMPGRKRYLDRPGPVGRGIGSTDEYFAETFQIPSWTWEIEPSDNRIHPDLPGCGADYGGFAVNCHDGFILPESEIQRVREGIAGAAMVAYYHQSGPPIASWVRVVAVDTGAVVFESQWDVVSQTQRERRVNALRPLQAGQDYELWVAFNKPMRWDQGGEAAALPGQANPRQLIQLIGSDAVALDVSFDVQWLDAQSRRYRYDTMLAGFTVPQGAAGNYTLSLDFADFVNLRTDSDPATVVDWVGGAWSGYENQNGLLGDAGGPDRTVTLEVVADDPGDAFVVNTALSGSFFDPSRSGEGFFIEVLNETQALLFWSTYDELGAQRWLFGDGVIRGNEISFDNLAQPTGGTFGSAFDPGSVVRERPGPVNMVFVDCNTVYMQHDFDGRAIGRQDLTRLTSVKGLNCESAISRSGAAKGGFDAAPSHWSGTWYGVGRSGEGFTIEVLPDDRVFVHWATFDTNGNQIWIFGVGRAEGEALIVEDAKTTSGGRFGDDFDPELVQRLSWGRLELRLNCEDGEMLYESVLPEFGQGQQSLVRLTALPGLTCS